MNSGKLPKIFLIRNRETKVPPQRHHECHHVYIEDRLPVAYAAKDLPPYNTVFYYFSKWKHEGVFEELMDTLHRMVRKLMGGRNPRSRHH